MSEEKIKISVKNITKRFELMKTRSEKILNMLSFSAKKDRAFWALKGVSFDVFAGEAIGVVGLNGSGKSTLLNIVSGIYPQTTGELTINGNTSIISIGAGLKPALTGRDNIQLKLLMSGLTKKQIKAIAPTIIAFSELGDFIDQPVKSYSSGMKAKLGFSIMAHTDPDIMIIDEALSVGDSTFAKKSFEKIREFKAQGKTIFFVSHSAEQVKQIADRVIWMHFGDLHEIGPAKTVMKRYTDWQRRFSRRPRREREKYILKMKSAQKNISAVEIVKKQIGGNISNINKSTRVAIYQADKIKNEQEKLIKKATRKTQKQIQNVKFGIFNWIIVVIMIAVVGMTASITLADSKPINKETDQNRQRKKENSFKDKGKESSKSNISSNKESSISSSETLSAEDSEVTNTAPPIVDNNANGIPDDQEPAIPPVADSSYVAPDTTYVQPPIPENPIPENDSSGTTGENTSQAETSTVNTQPASVEDSTTSTDSATTNSTPGGTP